MANRQFSITTMFLVTTALALACAALANANSWWWSLVYTVSFLSVIVSCVTALFAQGATRAFAVGIVLTSVIYAYHFVAPYLLSDQILRMIESDLWPTTTRADADYKSHFSMIWYTLWGAPFSLFGGLTARFVYSKFRPVLSATD
jgi:hypothetical protein